MRGSDQPTGRRRRLTLDDILAVRTPCWQHRVALSPDGRFLAYATHLEARAVSLFKELPSGADRSVSAGTELWVTDLIQGESRPLLGSEGRSWRPSWSPDGTHLAFYADHTGRVQLWCWKPSTGEARVVSDATIYSAPFGIDTPRWSPDSSRVYLPLRPAGWRPGAIDERDSPTSASALDVTVDVLVSPAPPRQTGPSLPPERQAHYGRDIGVVEVDTGYTRRLLAGFPALGIFASPDARWLAIDTLGGRAEMTQSRFLSELYLLPSTGGEPILVAEALDAAGSGRHEPAWSPDSTQLAFVREGELWVVTVGDSTSRKVSLDAALDHRLLLWHPSGEALLARQRGSCRFWLVPVNPDPVGLQSPRPLDLPAGRRTPAILRRLDTTWFWSPDGRTYIASTHEPDSGRDEFWRVHLDGSAPELLLSEDRTLTAAPTVPIGNYFGDVSADGRTVVYAAEDEAHPTEFWVSDASFAHRRPATRLNPHLDDVAFGHSQFVTWTTPEGQEVKAVLLLPPDYQAGRRIPLIVSVVPADSVSGALHRWGGPGGGGTIDQQILASQGYALLITNVPSYPSNRATSRRSYSLAAWVSSAVNAVVGLGIADPDRVGVMGGGFGASAVNRIITETNRFKAAISTSGVADAVSCFGELRLGPAGEPYIAGASYVEAVCGGPPWEKPLAYISESPIFWLDRVETPLLLIAGTEEGAVGSEQASEMFVGLLRLGKKATLLRYRGEMHLPDRFREGNQRDVVARIIAWLGEHLR